MNVRTTPLSEGWHWKERDPARQSVLDEVPRLQQSFRTGLNPSWTSVRSFPSEIHVELLKNGRIPDPFVGFNEHKCLIGVGEREWLYYLAFPFESRGGNEQVEFVFEGLDTICDVYLNYKKILSADNMFRTYSVSLKSESLHSEDNKLLLHFKSAKVIAKQLEARYGRVRAGSTNLGDPSRVYVRKAQYGWRWDWGPELMTCGPYRPINFIAYSVRLASIYPHASVSPSPALSPALGVDVMLAGDASAASAVKVVLVDAEGDVMIKEEHLDLALLRAAKRDVEFKNVVNWSLDNAVQLWWPVGYGEQKLYTVEVVLLAQDSTVLDRQRKRIGFRRVELVQEPLEEADRHGQGTTFLFEINGVRMFMGGSNWIPADSFLTELTPARYRAWLTLLRDGNQNMVRLWGGGVYEPDVFYDTCDELGLLVWQDFQFACGVYPAHHAFVASVRDEAADNVKRLRHHPSIALFCGNNEDYQQVLQWGGITELPARLIYEDVLPSVVAELTDPPIPYHRGSPYGGKGWDTTDPTVGDIHQWDIWAGRERPWQEYGVMGGRFVSEFGIPAMPDIRTVDYWLAGNSKERWAQSKLMTQHNRAGNHERRFAILMNENFRLTSDLETHIYNTQLMQSEAVSFAYRMWRREWRGRGKEFTAGALVWQLNDCWPVTSWAIADYFLRPKPAYYSIARELAPIAVSIFRTVIKNRDNDRPKQFYEFGAFQSVAANIEVWATNSTLEPHSVRLVLQSADLSSLWTHTEIHDVVVHPNQSTELLSMPCPCPPPIKSDDHPMTTSHSIVVGARLEDPITGEILTRCADWPQPYRLVDVPDPNLEVHVEDERIQVKAQRPVKCLVFSVLGDEDQSEVKWSHNALDLMPGDTQILMASGLGKRKLQVAYFGKEKATLV
ncbi:glycoside hydrolase family 2 protein [Wolfiporia cocos MD-104 SS10]|uniref:Beta-mannosidase B n=1 Tax=Wolfiporia cocos (strain MD-104) TaxID=742152 RepID=A0A2H3JS03_WOLCO|nr:glycoside hydrolase family 2 protein [Wolfiporia cocos MD-104 SS10]